MRRLLYAICVLFVAAALGCGDDPAGQSGTTTDGGATSDTGPDAGAGDDVEDPDPGADEPRFVRLSIDPSRSVYSLSTRLALAVKVFDVHGDEMSGVDTEITVEPSGAAAQADDGRWELAEEGEVVFRACTKENGPDGTTACDAVPIMVDDGPPEIVVDSPLPGDQLDAVASPMIEVTGSVSDTHGEPMVFVNGEPVDVDENGAFTGTVPPRFGINALEVAASDGVHPKTSTQTFDVLWANDYLAVPTSRPEVSFDDAILLRLGQRFVDDGMRLSSAPDGSFKTKDLADVLELVLRNVDFMSQIPDPVIDSSSLTLRVTDVTIGKPRITGDITDDGIELYIQISDLVATTDGSLTFDQQQLDLSGNVSAILSALVAMKVSKPSAADPLVVEVEELNVAVEDATAQFNSTEANAIFELAQSALRDTIETLITDTLQSSFVDQLPALIEDTLGALDDALKDQSFELDTGLGEPITLNFDGEMTSVETVFRDHLSAPISATAWIDGMPVFPQSRGVAALEPDPTTDPFFHAGRVQLGVRHALANGLLHALWNAGLLEADITELVPVGAESATLSAKLPPVMRPPLLGEPYDFVLELGQLEITAELLGRTEVYGVGLSTGISFQMNQGELNVIVSDDPDIRTWIISTTEASAFLTPDALESLLRNQLWPDLKATIGDSLSLPLPVPDLSGLGSIAAPLANLMMQFELVRPTLIRDGFLVIDTLLAGTLSANP